jgi:hypothetical protein
MVNNSTLHNYQQNEQRPLNSNNWTQKTMTYGIGNQVLAWEGTKLWQG